MTGLLYLTFEKNNEVLTAADPASIILMLAQTSFILSFISLFVMGCEEALIRKVFFRKKPQLFDELFEIQKEMQNILMGLLSVLAVVAAVFPAIAEQLNRALFFCGIILFACIVVTSLYDWLFLRSHAIEEILRELGELPHPCGARRAGYGWWLLRSVKVTPFRPEYGYPGFP